MQCRCGSPRACQWARCHARRVSSASSRATSARTQATTGPSWTGTCGCTQGKGPTSARCAAVHSPARTTCRSTCPPTTDASRTPKITTAAFWAACSRSAVSILTAASSAAGVSSKSTTSSGTPRPTTRALSTTSQRLLLFLPFLLIYELQFVALPRFPCALREECVLPLAVGALQLGGGLWICAVPVRRVARGIDASDRAAPWPCSVQRMHHYWGACTLCIVYLLMALEFLAVCISVLRLSCFDLLKLGLTEFVACKTGLTTMGIWRLVIIPIGCSQALNESTACQLGFSWNATLVNLW